MKHFRRELRHCGPSRCLLAAKEGRQDDGINVGAGAGTVACGTVSPARTFALLGRAKHRRFTKGPAAGTLSHLARDCVMRTVFSSLSSDLACAVDGWLPAWPRIDGGAYTCAAQGTPEQRAACEQDAYRLCSQYIPDERRTGNCLRRNRISLSPACRALFQRPQAATLNGVRLTRGVPRP